MLHGQQKLLFTVIILAGTSESASAISSHSSWTYLEGEPTIFSSHFKQLIATAITSSFTQRNYFTSVGDDGHNTLTPTVLINKEKFFICLYDCNKDILMISDKLSMKEPRNIYQHQPAFFYGL